jgi:hypothetical protein
MSLAVYKDIRSINALALICKTKTKFKRTVSKVYPTNKLTNLKPIVEAKVKIEFVT